MRAPAAALIACLGAVCLAAAGCMGNIGGQAGAGAGGMTSPGAGGSNPTGSPTGAAGVGGTTVATGAGGSTSTTGVAGTGITGNVSTLCAQQAGALRVGRTPLRRMTRTQFDHTVRDLLGTTGTPSSALSLDERIGPFFSNAIAPITELQVTQAAEVAAMVAAQAAPRMTQIVGCDLAAETGTTTTCATRFISELGAKAYRRPLETVERDKYLALYAMEKAAGSAETAFVLVVETMLQSPFFLYHVDIGPGVAPGSTPIRLDPYQLASRLSYFLWDTMPDAALFAAAANGSLQDPAVLATQVERMLADAKAGDAVPAFFLQWLGIGEMDGIDKDAQRFPQFNAALVTAMRAETMAFSDYVVRRGDGLMSTLFKGGFTFPQGPLFQLYGLTQPSGFRAGDQVPTNAGQRAGLLTQAAFLAKHAHRDQTSPVHRGVFVRENVLCQPLQDPPPGVSTTPPAVSDATTTRARFAQHEADPFCGGCHVQIDPIGLAFEHYDAIGAYRIKDGVGDVDASGEVYGGTGALAGKFVGAIELSNKLAASTQAADCLSKQWFRFALGRMESNDDACSIDAINKDFAASGGNVRQLMSEIVQSVAFRHVRATQ